MSAPTPEQVSAALDRGHVRLMGVFCDECEITMEADFIVRDRTEGLAAVRAWVEREHGWRITPQADLCGDCTNTKGRPR